MNLIFRAFLTLSALSLFVSLYLINRELVFSKEISAYICYSVYIISPFVFSFIGILLSKKMGNANLGEVRFVEPSNNDFLSNYLAFFFVALSLNDWTTFFFCLGLTSIFTLYSRVSYFNPVLLIFRYNFYYVYLSNDSKVMLITKQKIKSPTDIQHDKFYKRINDYTFID